MRIQYMSDLHLEFQENSRYLRYNELPVTGDVLVLSLIHISEPTRH